LSNFYLQTNELSGKTNILSTTTDSKGKLIFGYGNGSDSILNGDDIDIFSWRKGLDNEIFYIL
jgi:hypothetical protein